jgi:hypothetical protein
MKMENYLKFPLALLRHSLNPVDHFEKAELFAAVNAGIGFRKNHFDREFQAKLEEVSTDDCDEEAVVGANLCGITLGDGSGQTARVVYESVLNVCAGSPLVNMSARFFNKAFHSAQCEVDEIIPVAEKWINWREYRLIAAIYSLQWNSRNYCEAGWETIRNRASGFHNKASFREFEESSLPWPDHITPLSRNQTTRTIENLEELRFFLRVRISSNQRHGGKYAYSIKHESREVLIRDAESKQAYSRGDILRENRAKDHLLQLEAKAEREKLINVYYAKAEAIRRDLEKKQELQRKLPSKADKHSKPASHLQVVQQGGCQHNEKSSDDKFRDEKSSNEKSINNNIPTEVGVLEEEELGYVLMGRFLAEPEANYLLQKTPDLYSHFKPVKRIVSHDGSERIEERQRAA